MWVGEQILLVQSAPWPNQQPQSDFIWFPGTEADIRGLTYELNQKII